MVRILKGDLIFSRSKTELVSKKDSYLVAEDGKIQGVYEKLPEAFQDCPVEDYTGHLIIPGLTDLHVHAPQYEFRGLGMDMELLPWLNHYAFPEESRYHNIAYAKKRYEKFVRDLKDTATTRAVIFGTRHRPASSLLMELLEESGMSTMVGKVNMDRNASEQLVEETEESVEETLRWLAEVKDRFHHTKPILTPRFVPSCSDELMRRLGKMAKEQQLPVQSHLSENRSEISWVAELCPESSCYADAYDRCGLFGKEGKAVMAHCVYSDESEEEWKLLKQRNVWVAHCPESNLNLSSGFAPIKKLMEEGVQTGLGSDVAGGSGLSIFAAMAHAIRVSKMRRLYTEDRSDMLSVAEAFYLASKGGGSFFGKVGSFEEGFELDAVVLQDCDLYAEASALEEMTLFQRLERLIYETEKGRVRRKISAGRDVVS